LQQKVANLETLLHNERGLTFGLRHDKETLQKQQTRDPSVACAKRVVEPDFSGRKKDARAVADKLPRDGKEALLRQLRFKGLLRSTPKEDEQARKEKALLKRL
jgi:hypothetical protein